ncbi:MAG: hypothetical protein KDK04_03300 [Candidatus Competibacteraceae bacterium]|nr:hypothetical protein [Candidatus Competibacteraceae bacterium]
MTMSKTNGRFITWMKTAGFSGQRKGFAPIDGALPALAIRIENIHSFDEFKTAMQISARVFVSDTLEQLAGRCANKPYYELLVAAFTGSAEQIERARQRYDMRKKLRLISSAE